MDEFLIDGFIKIAEKCEGTKSSPVGSPRQRSFCKRMCGHKKKNTKSKAKKNPDSCINQALRRWKCRCSSINESALVTVGELVLDDFLGKVAQEEMDEECCSLLSYYVAFTRALYTLHQQNHWDAQSYGDHLLFQRLYEESQDLADDAAERVIGLCGELMHLGSEAVIAKKYAPKEKTLKGILESSLAISKAFQEMCKKVLSKLEEKDALTLGLDDLIMSQAGEGETHIYLLQQALKGSPKVASASSRGFEVVIWTKSKEEEKIPLFSILPTRAEVQEAIRAFSKTLNEPAIAYIVGPSKEKIFIGSTENGKSWKFTPQDLESNYRIVLSDPIKDKHTVILKYEYSIPTDLATKFVEDYISKNRLPDGKYEAYLEDPFGESQILLKKEITDWSPASEAEYEIFVTNTRTHTILQKTDSSNPEDSKDIVKAYIRDNRIMEERLIAGIRRVGGPVIFKYLVYIENGKITFGKVKSFGNVKHDNNSADDPCWKNYEMVGMKKHKGKMVPNCVPKKKK